MEPPSVVVTRMMAASIGAELPSSVDWFGLAPGTGFAIVALVFTTAYLTILKADDQSHTKLRNALIGMAIPLLIVFAAIVFWQSLKSLGLI